MNLSETRYAMSGDTAIAYRVGGEGPIDLVHTPGAVSNVELMWDHPLFARYSEQLGSFARVIHFDKRGTGLWDRVRSIASLEEAGRRHPGRHGRRRVGAGGDHGRVRGRADGGDVRGHAPRPHTRPHPLRGSRDEPMVTRLSVGRHRR